MITLTQMLSISLGASLGALARYFVGVSINSLLSHALPMGTLVVNTLGCFAIALFSSSWFASIDHSLKQLLIVGFCGSFTTFSTFALEVFTLSGERHWGWVLAQLALHLVLPFAAFALGLAITHRSLT